jgi:hypothetical protein
MIPQAVFSGKPPPASIALEGFDTGVQVKMPVKMLPALKLAIASLVRAG